MVLCVLVRIVLSSLGELYVGVSVSGEGYMNVLVIVDLVSVVSCMLYLVVCV